MPTSNGTSTIYKFDGFKLDLDTQTISRAGEAVALTPKVFELLAVLIKRRGQLLSKEELMERLWPDAFVEEANLAQNVAVLRKALGDNSRSPKYIVTVPGRGYRFIAEVELVFPDAAIEFEATRTPTGRARSRRYRQLAAAAVIFAAALAAFATYLYRYTGRPITVDRTTQLTAWSGLDLYPVISPDGSTLAFCSDRSGRLEIFTRQMLQGAKEVQVTSDGARNCQPSFSPDGSQIAYASHGERPGIYVVPSSGGAARRLSAFGTQPAWSPDGARIAFQSDPLTDLGSNVRNAMPPSTLWIVPVDSGEPRQLTKPGMPAGGHGAPAWSPDGTRIVFDANDWAASKLWTVALEDGAISAVEASTRSESDPVFAPDGRSIYYVSEMGGAILNVSISRDYRAVSEPTKLLDASGARVRQISIDKSGTRIVYATLSMASNIWLTRLDGGKNEPIPLTRHANTRTVLPAFSPDGTRIAYQSFKTGSLAHLWIMSADGGEQRLLSSRPAFNATWSRDNSTVWFISPESSGTSYWSVEVNTGYESRLFDFDEPEVYGARSAADGSLVVFNSKRTGTSNIWGVPMTGGPAAQMTFDEEFAGFPAWSPDGAWIAMQIKRGDDTHVAVMPAGGGEVIQLTDEKGQAWVNGWAADNDRIIFAGQRNGIWNVFSVSRTTREVRQLTDFERLNAYVRYPSISPLGDKVAYEYAETTGNVWMIELK